MTSFLDQLFNIQNYPSRATKENARLIYGFTLFMIVAFLLYAMFVTQGNGVSTLLSETRDDSIALLSLLSVLSIGLLTLLCVRVGRAELAALGPVVMWYFSGTLLGIQGHFRTSDEGAALLAFIFFCGLFLRARGLIVGTVVALGTIAFAASGYDASADPGYANVIIGLALQTVAIAFLIFLFLRGTRLDQRVVSTQEDEQAKLAKVTGQIAQQVSQRLPINILLTQAVEAIRATYPDIYHAQVFLTDERGEEANLVASTGEVGRSLLQRQHRLAVGSRSVVGAVTQSGTPLIARADAPSSLHRRNDLLPDTLVEAALPLKIGDTVLGALDLQSRLSDAFDDADLPVFQALADSIALAIDNLRLAEQNEQRRQENLAAVEQMRSAMGEVERLNRSLTQQVWAQYLGNKGQELSLDLDFSTNIVGRTGAMTPTISEAMQANQLTQTRAKNSVIVSMPLRVRGLVVGAMEFELEGDDLLAPEDVDLVEAVAERFSLAVESTRLYEESRRVAQRETMLNEIGGRLQRTNSINAVLTEAARGLQSTLGANRVAIRLGAPPAPTDEPITAEDGEW
jgi:transcriptional regulator with GAF, ATPase, and Fis domain